ncbi:MAG: hypothetical protein AAB408_00145 [Patescibacteria group bacterium]
MKRVPLQAALLVEEGERDRVTCGDIREHARLASATYTVGGKVYFLIMLGVRLHAVTEEELPALLERFKRGE